MAMTERELADIGNRTLKTPGSIAWCWQTITALQFMWENLEICYGSYVRIWREAEQHEIWKKVPPENPFGSKEAMLQRLRVADDDVASAKIAELAVVAKPLKPHGGEGNNRKQAGAMQVGYGSRGADYLSARIARDHPEIHRRMMNGEYKSVAAAARAAGIYRPRPKSVGLISDVERVATNIRKHYTSDQVKALKDAL